MMDLERIVTDTLRVLRDGTGRPIGDHEAPDPAPAPDGYPYGVLYVVTGGQFDGPALVAPEEHVDLPIQVTSVGLKRAQCMAMSDRVRHILVVRSDDGGLRYQVPNVAYVEPDTVAGVEVEGVPPHRVYSQAQRFTFRLLGSVSVP